MMKLKTSLLAGALAGATLLGFGAVASATTIDFEDGSAGTAIGSTYSSEGATFYGGYFQQCVGGCPAPVDGLFASSEDEASPFTVDFATTQSSISFYNVTYSSVVATAYSSTGQDIGTISSTDFGTITPLTITGPGIAFATFSFIPGQGTGGYGIDDLTFGSAAPEPSTWLLMFAGVGLAGYTLRRSRKVSAVQTA